MSWLLKKFYMLTIALLSGFMIGSLLKVWPWKVAGAVEGFDYPAFPGAFEAATGTEPYIVHAAIFAIIGFLVVFMIEIFASNNKK